VLLLTERNGMLLFAKVDPIKF